MNNKGVARLWIVGTALVLPLDGHANGQVIGESMIDSFTAHPKTIASGDTTQLQWSVKNATSVEIEPELGSVALSGNTAVSPTSTTQYIITARSNEGSESRRVTIVVLPQKVEKTNPTPKEKLLRESDQSSDTESHSSDKLLALCFGTVFVIILLIIAIFDRNPPPFSLFVYRVILALAAAGVGAVIPGIIDVTVNGLIRAGGAFGLFVIVFWFNPPQIVTRR